MNEPQQLEGPGAWRVDSEAASLKPERKGPVERETLEMWERLANSYKESTEEEGCDANWWKSFPWKEHFLFQMWDERKSAWKEIFWGREWAMRKGKSNTSLFRPAYRAYSPGRILRTHFSKPVHHPGLSKRFMAWLTLFSFSQPGSGGRLSPSCGVLDTISGGLQRHYKWLSLRAGYTGCLGSLITVN